MTTPLALTPGRHAASVLVDVTGAPDGDLTILRSDLNGTQLVRLYANQVPDQRGPDHHRLRSSPGRNRVLRSHRLRW